jgi:DNA repair protein RecN (Recombination protein N)
MHLQSERKRLLENAEALARELDLLSHQVAEIDEAALQIGEEEELLVRQRTGANAHRLCAICSDLTALLSEAEDSMISRWGDVSRLMRELQRLDAQTEPLSAAAIGIFDALQNLTRDVDRYAALLDANPESLEATEARLDTIQNLKRKYGSTIDAKIKAAIHPTFRPPTRQPIQPTSQIIPTKAKAEGNRAVHSETPKSRIPTALIQ